MKKKGRYARRCGLDRRPRECLSTISLPLAVDDEEEDAGKRASTTTRYRGREFHDRAQRATYLLSSATTAAAAAATRPLSLTLFYSCRSSTAREPGERRSRALAIGRRTGRVTRPSQVAVRRRRRRLQVALLLPRCLRLDEGDRRPFARPSFSSSTGLRLDPDQANASRNIYLFYFI